MASDEYGPKQRKSNDINGLPRCPQGRDVGVFGKAIDFADGVTAGFIYAAAINELVVKTEELHRMLGELDEEERVLIPTLQEDLAAIDTKWILATAMFNINA